MKGPIVLLSDFGYSDPFVGVMKGVIAGIAPKARVIDLCHEIAPQDVRSAAFHLRASAPFFPKGSLFVAIVDPGVGSSRKVLWARTAKHEFLAPDNGLLSWIAEPILEWREVSNSKLWLSPVSTTFHGRDIFAPVAAHLARGKAPRTLGPSAKPSLELPFPRPRIEGGKVVGEIIGFDRFGNAVTSIPREAVGDAACIRFGDADLGPISATFAGQPEGSVIAVVGSAGFVELAVRNGNFAKHLKAAVGDLVEAGN
jgi:S-adenosylmethionine hydrolase